jgi:hypothetical protein
MYLISNVSDTYTGCENEQQFKKLYCVTELKKQRRSGQKIFNIETEETVAGFPDVMELWTANLQAGSCTQAFFYEFKISDLSGSIKFQPTQPAFYKHNSELPIKVVAYNRFSKRVHVFSTNEIFDKNSPYYTTNGRVGLTGAEKELGI